MSKRLDETVLECGDELKSLKMSGEEGERHKHVVHSRKSGLVNDITTPAPPHFDLTLQV